MLLHTRDSVTVCALQIFIVIVIVIVPVGKFAYAIVIGVCMVAIYDHPA